MTNINIHWKKTMAIMIVSTMALLACSAPVNAETEASLHARNEAAKQEAVEGTRAVASAAWWGFDSEDSTEALQAAINSRARTLVVPYMGAPWIVRPLTLRGDLEILFEPGVLVLAKKGEFRGKGDSLFSAVGAENLTVRGYGATLRMRKKDYQNSPYDKAEWRMGLALRGCKNVLVEGLRIESTGGDGLYVDGGGNRKWSEDITIRNVACHDNHRQGISVISAQNLLVEGCTLSGTKGTPPEAGIDLEPDSADQRLVNCVIRNCVMENNNGHEILVYMKPLSKESEPVSVLFENCVSRMGTPGQSAETVRDTEPGGWAGMAVGAVRDDGARGTVEFRNCVSENTGREGAKVFDKSAEGVLVRFVNCSWRNPWLAEPLDYAGPRVPVSVHLRDPAITAGQGGVEFVDCHVYDTVDRPALAAVEDKSANGVRGLRGKITVHSPFGARADFGPNPGANEIKVSGP